jgi:hypothetical protein
MAQHKLWHSIGKHTKKAVDNAQKPKKITKMVL